MFILRSTNWPLVSISFSKSEWPKEQYNEFLKDLKALMVKGEPMLLLIAGSTTADNPPLKCWPWILAGIMSLRPLFDTGLERTAIYKPTDSCDALLKFIFAMYKPVKPMAVFKDFDAAVTWLNPPLL